MTITWAGLGALTWAREYGFTDVWLCVPFRPFVPPFGTGAFTGREVER